jgi:uncharacterized membrane protein
LYYVKLGQFIAAALIFLGAIRFALGLWVASTFDTQEGMTAASRRYLATNNSGEAIDQALWMIVAGVVVGLLAKIATNPR